MNLDLFLTFWVCWVDGNGAVDSQLFVPTIDFIITIFYTLQYSFYHWIPTFQRDKINSEEFEVHSSSRKSIKSPVGCCRYCKIWVLFKSTQLYQDSCIWKLQLHGWFYSSAQIAVQFSNYSKLSIIEYRAC